MLCTDHTPYTLQLGTGLRGLIPELTLGSLVSEHLEMTIPYLGWDFDMASSSGRKGSYILKARSGLELKGGIYPSKLPDGTPVILFLGSPRLNTLDEMQVCGAGVGRVWGRCGAGCRPDATLGA